MLPAIQVPTLLLYRAVGDGAESRDLAERIPHARVVHLPGNDLWGIFLSPEIPDEIERFVTRREERVEPDRVLTTVLFFKDLGSSSKNQNVFTALVALFLWFTVLFANFAEAIAEGRGKAQADTLRKARTETVAQPSGAAGSGRSPTSRADSGWSASTRAA